MRVLAYMSSVRVIQISGMVGRGEVVDRPGVGSVGRALRRELQAGTLRSLKQRRTRTRGAQFPKLASYVQVFFKKSGAL